MIPQPFSFNLFEPPPVNHRVLMLDYDGTLAPFSINRMAATPFPGVSELLGQLINLPDTHLAIVTGRPLSELELLLQPPPGIDLWGSHGWERRHPGGKHSTWPKPDYVMTALAEAQSRIIPHIPKDALETKHGAVVLHTRALDDHEHERIRHTVHEVWTPLLSLGRGLVWREYNRGFEFLASLRTKGSVVDTLREDSPPGVRMTYLGDDLTDEDAFERLAPPDWAILVADRPRESHATWWLRTPDGVMSFLRCWISQSQ